MVAGGHIRPPYRTALVLSAWAWENRSFIEGRVALAGGDPDGLSFKRFLDISYSILVDEYQRSGMNLVAALEAVRQYASGFSTETPETVSSGSVVAQNQQAMAQLQAMMKGVKK